jgi:hypothetical protein
MTSVHDDLRDLERRLFSYMQTLKLLNSSVVAASQASIERKLKKLMDEMRDRWDSAGSCISIESLDLPDKEAWREIRKELQEIGISPNLFTQHREFIISTIRDFLDQEYQEHQYIEGNLLADQTRISETAPGLLQNYKHHSQNRTFKIEESTLQ